MQYNGQNIYKASHCPERNLSNHFLWKMEDVHRQGCSVAGRPASHRVQLGYGFKLTNNIEAIGFCSFQGPDPVALSGV